MLVEVAIAIAMLLDFEPEAEAPHGLATKVSDSGFGSEPDRVTCLPYAITQVHLFVLIEELLIEPIQLPQQAAAKHYATPRLPVNVPFRVPIPTYVKVGREHLCKMPERPEIKRSQPRSPNWKEKGLAEIW